MLIVVYPTAGIVMVVTPVAGVIIVVVPVPGMFTPGTLGVRLISQLTPHAVGAGPQLSPHVDAMIHPYGVGPQGSPAVPEPTTKISFTY